MKHAVDVPSQPPGWGLGAPSCTLRLRSRSRGYVLHDVSTEVKEAKGRGARRMDNPEARGGPPSLTDGPPTTLYLP